MKKVRLIYLFFAFSLSFAVMPQGYSQSFEQGLLSVSPGVNIGSVGFYGGGSGLPLIASAEYGILDMVGAGPFLGFVNYKFSGTSDYSYRFVTFGVRGDFHYSALLEELLDANVGSEKLDLYIALLLGYQTASYTGPDGAFFGSGFANRSYSGVAIGGKYYFSEKLGVFAEFGRILYGNLNVGITLRLK